jgi:hypothetical protein
MNKKILASIAVVALLCVTLVSSTAFTSKEITQTTDDAVSQSEVDNVAMYWMEQSTSRFPTWDGAKLGTPVTYYSVENTSIPIAYEYTVLNGEKSVGHMIVSASKDLTPVLEFGEGHAPSSYLDNANKNATEKGYITSNEAPLILYWGAATYSVQFGEQMKKDRVAIHLPTGRLQKVPDTMRLQFDIEQARVSWDTLSSSIANKSGELLRDVTALIADAPAYHQGNDDNGYGDDGDGVTSYPSCVGTGIDFWDAWDGCSAIAGAMIHAYWDSHGYSGLPNGEDTLIDHNHHYMGTDDEGETWPTDIDNGIRDIFDVYGYGDDFDVNNNTGTDWNDIVTQIGYSYPAVMSFLGGDWGGHSTELIGYAIESSVQYIIVHNTWDTTNDYFAYGNWTICQMTSVEEA